MNREIDNNGEDEGFEPGAWRSLPQKVAVSKGGMIATAHHRATQAGTDILKAGGNAMDAAIAAAFALGVCEPAASGLGGQTMMLVYDAASGKRIALDGSSRAPNRVAPGILPKPLRLRGHMASTVPSTPAVLAYALERYGSLPLSEVLDPALFLAEEGYRISQLQYDLTVRELRHLRGGTAASFFLRGGKRPYPVGARFRQPVLGGTLRRLAEAGVEDFYQGEIARRIAADMENNGGLIRADDLAQIPWPVEREPLTTKFHHWRVFTMPPPGAGRVLVEMLNLFERLPDRAYRIDSPRGAHFLAEVIRQANQDRRDLPFDPSLHPQEKDEERMLADGYVGKMARRIRERVRGHGETTHLSVMDREGNMVALTQSIERVYGSFAAAPDLGFLYNNYMMDFEYDDITHPHYLRPNAVPWATVTPTLVFKGRHPWMAIGSPGSARIASALLQVLIRLKNGESPFDAVDGPRLHCSVQGKVSLENARMRNDIPQRLEKHGFTIDPRGGYSFFLGCVQMVMRGTKGRLMGVADPRRDGSAGGI